MATFRAKDGVFRVMSKSLIACLAVIALGGCTAAGPSLSSNRFMRGAISCADKTATDLAAEAGYSADYLHRWQTYDGCDVRLDYVMTRSSACSAGVDEILMGWPVGSTHNHHDSRIFVRDPQGTMTPANATGFDAHASLPSGAEDTGLRQNGAALWVIPGGDAFVWVVDGANVERWPIERPIVGCG